MNARLRVVKAALWAIAGSAAGVSVVRFTRGLGATTALTDVTPWGLWIGFDVMGGVAMAAGGFVVAALAHIFHRQRYRHVVRPAVLTALLGYAAVAVGLLYDLGLPWNIWHMTIFWNPRSPLFEVGWCVMLYLTVLVLEFAPVLLERTRFQATYRRLLRLQLPLIVLGIALSTLHQSSLGSLMLIMPFRLHELWYTARLPELFFATAICLGLAMVIFESTVTSWLYRRPAETEAVAGLARLAAWGLGLQLAFRVWDLAARGVFAQVFDWTREARLFQIELLLSSLLPIALFGVPRFRRRSGLMFVAAAASVSGFLLNRVNVSGLAHVSVTGSSYFPSWTEFAVSAGIVAGAALVFLWIQEHFPVDPEGLDRGRAATALQLFRLPRLGGSSVWLGDPGFARRRGYSLAFALPLAAALAFTPSRPLVEASPVKRARGGDLLRVGYPLGTAQFPHAAHVTRTGKDACGVCHHANKPGDTATPCSECHADLYLPTKIFTHAAHVSALNGNASCVRCHAEGRPLTVRISRSCSDCHAAGLPASPWAPRFNDVTAPGLRPSAHRLCIGCHQREAARLSPKRPELPRCATCHRGALRHDQAVRPALVSRDVTPR